MNEREQDDCLRMLLGSYPSLRMESRGDFVNLVRELLERYDHRTGMDAMRKLAHEFTHPPAVADVRNALVAAQIDNTDHHRKMTHRAWKVKRNIHSATVVDRAGLQELIENGFVTWQEAVEYDPAFKPNAERVQNLVTPGDFIDLCRHLRQNGRHGPVPPDQQADWTLEQRENHHLANRILAGETTGMSLARYREWLAEERAAYRASLGTVTAVYEPAAE